MDRIIFTCGNHGEAHEEKPEEEKKDGMKKKCSLEESLGVKEESKPMVLNVLKEY